MMVVEERYKSDAEAIPAKRHDNGGDLWTAKDGKLNVGSPFPTLNCAHLPVELGVDPEDPVLKGVADLFRSAQREDGRFKMAPQGTSIHATPSSQPTPSAV